MKRIASLALLLASLVLLSTGPARSLVISTGTFSFATSPWPDAPRVPLGGSTVPGLTTVDMRFDNGDHRVERLATFPPCGTLACSTATSMIVSLRDHNGDDPTSGTLRWAGLEDYDTIEWASANSCLGTCRLAIPRLAQGRLFALVGFGFRYLGDAAVDHNLREIAVRPDPYNGFVEVTFVDNDGHRPLQVVVAYTSVPYTSFGHYRASSTAAAHGVANIARTPGAAVLQGFRLGFTNGDHYLQRFTIDVANDRVVVRLRDVNGDDPFTWSVDYLVSQD